jgi:sugar/nucleoside kinase (ribokinase family)
VSADLAVATPTYVDLTFVGLEALPGPGDECFAGELLRSPGGGAITAIGAARLGLSTVLVSPLGNDEGGAFVRELLAGEGVAVGAPRGARTPTTVVMPVAGERAMVTVDPGVRATAAEIAEHQPRAVVANLELADLLPRGAQAYLTCGDDDARAYAGRLEARLPRARALICDRREAEILTGAPAAEDAAQRLAALGAYSVVVNQGPAGAVAALDGRLITVPAMDVGPGVDPTGDRDLLAAAYAWADLRGAAPEDQLRWAVLYAALSVRVPTGAAGAVTAAQLLDEGRRRGLPEPPGA